MKIKKFLKEILQELLAPIRERRKEFAKNPDAIMKILYDGTMEARDVAHENIIKLKTSMGINYFN